MSLDITAFFPARFQGECEWCHGIFQPREILTFVDDQLLCFQCTEEAKEFNRLCEFEERLRYDR